jgi:hypothetical protein
MNLLVSEGKEMIENIVDIVCENDKAQNRLNSLIFH